MAVQRVGIQFDFNANTKNAEANLNALEKTMQRLETRMQRMGSARYPEHNKAMMGQRNAQNALRQFGQTDIDLKTPIRQTEILTDTIRKGKMGWDDYGRAVKQNSAIVTQQLAIQTGAINNVRRAGQGFAATFTPNSMLKGISGVEVATMKMTAFGKATSAVSQHVIDMGKNLAFSARQMTISLSMPLAIMGGMAIKQFTDIDKHLTDISKVYDYTAEGAEQSVGRVRASMKELAKELSRTQGAEISDTLDIAQYYAQQGKTGDVLTQSTVQASRLMRLGDVNIDDATKTITTLTAVVGANVKELGKYVDYLNKVEDTSPLTMQDFAQTLPTIAPLVKTFIPDDKDALMSVSASMMEVAKRAGFNPKESSNAWKSMYGSFVRPTGQTADAFSELTGKYGQRQELKDVVNKRGGDPVQILQDMAEITKEWSTVDKGQLMTRLTGKWQLSRGLGFMNALDPTVGNNKEALERMSGINEDLVKNPEILADNSKRQMDLIRDSAHTKLMQLKQDVQMMFADLGERIFIPVMDALENVLGVAKGAYNALSNLPKPLKDILSIGAQLTFIAGPILAAFAATKMLAGFAGKLAASFATTAASAGRIGASMLGVKMMGSGKLESKDQSVAKIQEKSNTSLNLQMNEILEQENKARMRSVALVEEKNARTRESINLEREKNRAMTGTITPDGSPIKDPKKDLKKYQASLQSPTRDWPMAIQAKDIGPESFRRHAGRIGAPATRVANIGMDQNKVFGTNPIAKTVGLTPLTDATNARMSQETRQYIQKELDKVNAGLAIRRNVEETNAKEIQALRAERPGGRQAGTRGADALNRQRADIDNRISDLSKQNKAVRGDSTVAGAKSYGIDSLEQQRAQLIRAANGNHLQQAKIVTRLQAEQNFEADLRRKNNQAIAAETKATSVRAQMLEGTKRIAKDPLGALGNRMNFFSDEAPEKLTDRAKRFGRDLKPTLMGRFNRDAETKQMQEKAWSQNTVRGGLGEYFRGHMTPKDINTAQSSKQFKEIRMALEKSDESFNIQDLIKENEELRADYFETLQEEYKKQGHDSATSASAAQRDLEQSNLPTTAALEREAEAHMQRMTQRADNLDKRQQSIAENSGKWANNISNSAVALGVVGTMATSALGIQNKLVDGALMFANGIGAVGMLMPDVMEKVVGSFANFGATMIDKFDAKTAGTKLGSLMGDTMGTSLSGRMSKAFSNMGAMFMSAMPYLAGIAVAGLALKGIWNMHRKDSADYVKNLQEANKSVELHAELLGYVRKESKDLNDLTYKEATDKRAEAYRDNEDGRSNFVGTIASASGGPQSQIASISAVLNQEAIKILDDGGDEADVRSLVDAALQAAGIQDDKIIEGVKLNFKNFETTLDTAAGESLMRDLQASLSGAGTAMSSGDQFAGVLGTMNPFKGENWNWNGGRIRGEEEVAALNLSETAKADVEKWSSTLSAAINTADTSEQKSAIAKKYLEIMNAGRLEAEKSGDANRIGTSIGMRRDIFDDVLKNLNDNTMSSALLFNENIAKIKDNFIVLEAVMGGINQPDFDTPEKAAAKYEEALVQIEGAHGALSNAEKQGLHNAIAFAGGMNLVNGNADQAADALGRFEKAARIVDGVDLDNLTAQQFIDFQTEPDPEQMERRALQVKGLSEALRNSPEEFHKRWRFDVDVADQETIDQAFSIMRSGMQAGADYVAGEASQAFKDRQELAMTQIKNETDGAMKGLDAKQKASEKAFAARGKALDAQFKTESKVLDNQHKEEKKVYDKQQKERDKEFAKRQRDDQRAYDKQEKADNKAFSKMQQAERKSFDKSWDDRADSINDYYDNAVKAIENQGKAEEELDRIRERNADRERKRLAYLAGMANTNIDINVAVAGGNLDEAARLANSAASTTTDYYQDQINTEAQYASQDRDASRQRRMESIGESRTASMDEFGRLRDDATEGFSDSQELAQEKRDEELQLARDIYDEKKTLEAEQYEEQKALEAERFAERQALEKERLQEEQAARREALEAEKAAISERHSAEREMIQETARVKEDGARRHFEATQRALDMELRSLMAALPTSHEEMKTWIADIESTYARHGVYLDKDFAPKVQGGMMDAVTAAMDEASNKIQTDENWKNIGQAIGLEMREGTLKGYTAAQIASTLLYGTPIGKPAEPAPNPGFKGAGGSSGYGPANYSRIPPGRASGGPIFGPGSGTSDSILARLSNGEHVMTAKEVKNLGGHKAVERLRSDIRAGKIPAFATGGGIGASQTANSDLNVRVASTGTGTVADGGVLAAVTTDVANMGAAFDSTLTNTVAPAWQMFGDTMVQVKKDSIDPVLEGSKIALQDYANHTNQIMSANMNPAWVQFGQNLKMVKDTVWDVVMTDMKAGISSLSASIGTAIANEIMPKWTEGSNHVKTMQDTVIAPSMQQTRDATTETAQNFGTAADMIGTGWGRVKENSAEPVRYTIGTVFNDGLVGMWNKVADALDLEKMDKHEFSFATGGVLPGYTPGRDVHHFESPTGGKLHLSGGEAIMRPEWTKAVGGPAAVHRMNAEAKSGKVQRFAEGGVVHAPGKGDVKDSKKKDEKAAATPYGMPRGTNIQYGAPGFPSWVYNIGSQFGLMASTYAGHQEGNVASAGFMPNPQGLNRGIDWSGPIDKMHTFAQYLLGNGPSMPQLEQVIWMHPGTGQKLGWFGNRPDIGGSIYANDYGGHADHVHTRQSQSLDGTGSMDGVILGLGGMGMTIDPKIIAAVNTFNEEKAALKDKIKAHIDAGPDTIMKAIPGKIFSGITAGMDKKIQAAMPIMSGATIGAYGLNHEDHVREIIAAAHERGLPKEAARIAIATALVESELRMYASHRVPESLNYPHEAIGSDHTSVGLFQQQDFAPWGTVAERMNARASAHLFYNQLVKFDWQSMAPGDAAQKVQVSAFPAKYATRMAEADALMNMVGGYDANAGGVGKPEDKDVKPKESKFGGGGAGGYFDQGGIASGMGLMNKAVISPERVLSPRQTEAFEKLVPAMDRVAAGGLGEGDYMAKTQFDRSAAFQKMIERESQAKIDFTNILEKMTPILTQITGHIKSQIIPGITGYANDLIKLDTDAQRIDKVSEDIVAAINGMQIPEINTDMAFHVGGNIYGDAQLNAILEEHRRRIIAEVQAMQAMAQQQLGGK